ncbi:glycosyltransferase family 2 protein [Ruegeria sp. 2012CJ41-6]|uniref:Glycosyltransferase family 2 protein n=1 Tax=Ruegeria spongiae TaxID=2942209 RepID=A0ABT0Q4C2_9RHOB|nr:glycosyltransferase family 2 protein [Ruegeria spongiae]MCL6284708.1 glycosyltransferase family 2 protein [Ruegeria spongiae]
MRYLAVLTVRNEGAFLLDWLAHHQATGFTDFLVFSNDCQDGTDAILDRLEEMGHLTHLRNDGPYDKGGIQFTALKAASKHRLVKRADWILPLDVDEFVNIHIGDGSVQELTAALPDATAITLTWRLFGNGEVTRYADTSVPRTFTRCAPVIMHWPWRAAMFKTLYRNDGSYRKLGVHRPRSPHPENEAEARWFDGSGREIDLKQQKKRVFSDYGRDNYGLAQLNHYPLGAMESYVLKADRGRAVHSGDLLGMDYWVERNLNTETDDSILRISERADPLRAEMLEDPDLAHLHESAVNWRHERFRELMEQDAYRALFTRLLMTPPSRPVSASAAETLAGFASLGLMKTRGAGADNSQKET